jgi:PAS domain S-box-containing protein
VDRSGRPSLANANFSIHRQSFTRKQVMAFALHSISQENWGLIEFVQLIGPHFSSVRRRAIWNRWPSARRKNHVTTSGNPTATGNGSSSEHYAASGAPDWVAPRLRRIHEAASEFGIFMLDRSGRIVTWNARAGEACGYNDEQIVGRNFSCLYTDAEAADGQPALALARSVAQGRFEEQAPRRRRDGSSFWADVMIDAVHDGAGNHCGFACLVRDFSARGRTEQELQTRLAQQEAITRLGALSLEGASFADLKTQASMISTAGLNADFTAVLELDADNYNLTLTSTSDPNPTSYVGLKMPGGKYSLSGYTLFSNEPIISEDLLAETRFQPHPGLIANGARSGISVAIKSRGVALGVVATFTRTRRMFSQDDINFVQAIANILASALDRTAAEERLRHSEEYLRTVIEGSSESITVLDREGRIRFLSGSGEAMLGRKASEVIGRTAVDLTHPDDIPVRERIFAQALAQPGVPVSAQMRVRLANGAFLDCEIVMRALANIGGTPGVLVKSGTYQQLSGLLRSWLAHGMRRWNRRASNPLSWPTSATSSAHH